MSNKDELIRKNTNTNYPGEVNNFIINGTQDDIEVCVTNIIEDKATYMLSFDDNLPNGESYISKLKGRDGGLYFVSTFLLTDNGRQFMYLHKINIPVKHGHKIIGTGK